MKKFLIAVLAISSLCLVGFDADKDEFDIDHFDQYEKEFKSEDYGVCSANDTKTYEPYLAITNVNSKQYKIIHNEMTVDETTGLLYDEDGFIGVALGSYYGPIGSRYYITLSSGNVIPVIKVDAKSDAHTVNGCASEGSGIIEFVIDPVIAGEYFGAGPSGLANYGNFNNDKRFKGTIVKVELVLDEPAENGVYYEDKIDETTMKDEDVDQTIKLDGGLKK